MQKTKPFPPSMSLQHPLLAKPKCQLVNKIFRRSRFIFTRKAKLYKFRAGKQSMDNGHYNTNPETLFSGQIQILIFHLRFKVYVYRHFVPPLHSIIPCDNIEQREIT